MEDFVIDVIIGEGPNTRAVRMELEPFTLIGATTRFGSLSAPLRERFGITRRLNYYSLTELSQVIKRTGDFYHLQISPETVTLLASCARGTPRLANRFLRRLRDFCEVAKITTLEYDFAKEALLKLGVNLHGLDETDLSYLEVLIQRFHGGPAGVKNLATTLREEQETITEVIEPYLIQEQYLLRTKQGRVALPKAYIQFGLLPPVVE